MDMYKAVGWPNSSDMLERDFTLVLARGRYKGYVGLVHNSREDGYSFLVPRADFREDVDLKRYDRKTVSCIFDEGSERLFAVKGLGRTLEDSELLFCDEEAVPEELRERFAKRLGISKKALKSKSKKRK